MKSSKYSITQGYAQLSRIVAKVQASEPCIIARHGVSIASDVSIQQWQAPKQPDSLNRDVLSLPGIGCGV